jgi:hypothetical protein
MKLFEKIGSRRGKFLSLFAAPMREMLMIPDAYRAVDAPT